MLDHFETAVEEDLGVVGTAEAADLEDRFAVVQGMVCDLVGLVAASTEAAVVMGPD